MRTCTVLPQMQKLEDSDIAFRRLSTTTSGDSKTWASSATGKITFILTKHQQNARPAAAFRRRMVWME